MLGVDVDKTVTEGNSTPVGSPDGKVEMADGDIPTENGNNNVITDDKDDKDDKVSWFAVKILKRGSCLLSP